MTGKLTTKEVFFIAFFSQLPIGIIVSLLTAHLTTNLILAFITTMFVTLPTGWLVVWFADKVKQ